MKPLWLCLVLLAAPAAAGPLSLSFDAGAAVPLGTAGVRSQSRTGPFFGLTALDGVAPGWDAGLSYESVRMYKSRATRVEPVLLSLMHSFEPRGGWTPEARLGVGPATVHDARPDLPGAYTTYAIRLGGGMEHPLSGRWLAGFWVSYLLAGRANAATREVHAGLFGLSLRWRGEPLTPRAAAGPGPKGPPFPPAAAPQGTPGLTPAKVTEPGAPAPATTASAAAEVPEKAGFIYGVIPGKPLTDKQRKVLAERKGKVMDSNGRLVSFRKVSRSLTRRVRIVAEVAMGHGLTPVIVKGSILGYDDPINDVCILPDAVEKGLAAEIEARTGGEPSAPSR